MYTEGYEQWLKLSKNVSNPLADWQKTATRLCQHATEENLGIIGENFERFSDQLKRLSSIRKPEELLTLQKDCITEDINAAVENIQKFVHLSMGNMEELAKLWGAATTKIAEKAVEKAEDHLVKHAAQVRKATTQVRKATHLGKSKTKKKKHR